MRRDTRSLLLAALVGLFMAGAQPWIAHAQPGSQASSQPVDRVGLDWLCPLVEYESRRELEDHRMELELLRIEYRARSQVFEMVDQLWAAHAIEQELYLDYKRLRDRTKLGIARLVALVSRQESAVEQYTLACSPLRGRSVDGLPAKIAELQARYRRLDCEVLARDADVAQVDYEFDREILEATRKLNKRDIKSKYELVVDEFDLGQSKARLESHRRRARECRKRLQAGQPAP